MQDAFATLIAIAAAVFLLRRAWRRVLHRAGGCGQCAGCPSDGLDASQLVTLAPVISQAVSPKTERTN